MKIGNPLPTIQFKATNGIHTTFDHYKGAWLVLYFYPKDATPGCTIESCDFRDQEKEFSIFNTNIIGVSRDTMPSHEKFKTNQNLPFELISDPDETLCLLFDVIKIKSMYGKEVRGIERSTFIFDPEGIMRHEWRQVKVKGHVQEVLKTIQALQEQ